MNFENILTSLAQTAQTVLPLYQQKELLKLNIKRAEQGLPPIDPAKYAAGVNVGLSDSTRTLLYVGGGALLAFLFLREFRRR